MNNVIFVKYLGKKFTSRLYPEMIGDLTLDILKNVAEKKNYRVNCLEEKNDLEKMLDTDKNIYGINDKTLIGFSCNSGNVSESLKLARQIKNTYPSAKIIAGGPFFEPLTSKIVLQQNPQLDYIFLGPAEISLPDFLQKNSESSKIDIDVPGVLSAKNIDDIQKYKKFPNMSDIEIIPFQNVVDTIDPKKRSNVMVPLRTSFGCEGFCSFCYMPFKGWNGTNNSYLKELFSEFLNKGYRKFLIVDDNFVGTDLNRMHLFSENMIELKEKFGDFSFEFDARADSFGRYDKNNFDHNLVSKLKLAGVSRIFTGIESGNEEDLRYFSKFPTNISGVLQNAYYLENMKSHNIPVVPGFIMLTENSSYDRIVQNINFINKYMDPLISPEIYWYQIAYYPGSRLLKNKYKELNQKEDYEGINDLIYGKYKPKFVTEFSNNFSLILGKVKSAFSEIESKFNFDNNRVNQIIHENYDALKSIHTKYFLSYADAAKRNTLQIEPYLDRHIQDITQILKNYADK